LNNRLLIAALSKREHAGDGRGRIIPASTQMSARLTLALARFAVGADTAVALQRALRLLKCGQRKHRRRHPAATGS
jgi:hypothetical protein